MSQTSAGRAADTFFLPTLATTITQAGINTSVYTANTSTTEGRTALTLPSGNKKVYLTVAARTADAFIALKLGTATASVTTTTGFPIFAGTQVSGWINPNEVNDIEYITAAATGTIHWYVSSPGYEGT